MNDMFCADSRDECIFGLYGALYGLNVFLDPSLNYNSLNASQPFEAEALYNADSHDTRYDGVYLALQGPKHQAMPTFNSVLSASGAATFISMNERKTKRLSTPYHSKACSNDPTYSKSVCLSKCEEIVDDTCQLDYTKTLAENLHGTGQRTRSVFMKKWNQTYANARKSVRQTSGCRKYQQPSSIPPHQFSTESISQT